MRKRYMLAVVMAAALAVFGVFVAAGGAVTGSPSQFESGDGNMTLGASGNTDWNCFQGGGGFATLASGTPAGCAVTSGATQVNADSTSAGEIEQKPGQKFDTACPTFQGGNNPPKDEWSNIAEYSDISSATNSAGGHDFFFYGASIRPVVNGNSSANVYFNQSTSCRTVGDVLLAFDFLNGGGTPSLHSLVWETSIPAGGTGCFVSSDSLAAGCWGNEKTISSANFDGNVNTVPIPGTANAISGTDIAANALAEFGINLTQALGGGPLPCFANETWVSRSSGSSFTSNPEDVEIVNRPTCGKLTIIKHTDPRGIDQSFSYSTTGGLSPATFSLNDAGNSTSDNSANTRVYSSISAGTYTVTEGTEPFGFGFKSLSCSGGSTSISGVTATINLAPGDDVTCTYTNIQELGSINVTKTDSKSTAALPGATFHLTGPHSYDVSQTTGADGTTCFDHLPFGSYSIQETAAPTGYAIDDATAHSITIDTNGHCGTAGTVPFSATDTPLTDLSVNAAAEVAGKTKSQITCKDSGSNNVGDSPSANTDPASVTANGLKPGTYTCVVVIDP